MSLRFYSRAIDEEKRFCRIETVAGIAAVAADPVADVSLLHLVEHLAQGLHLVNQNLLFEL